MNTPHPLTNWALAALLAAVICLSSLLDGPTEIEAMQATQASTQDAINSAATNEHVARAEGQIDAQVNPSIFAKVTP